ncbi:DNA-3-methyladenine glycosylase 2 family protein [Acidovorax sp. 69]|uniref:DNA-3-methyladenine glycosylase 2 family protein n=1 Tax=Acidovorax sp. 69 TaxID=2035202 RepID=UPI001E2F5D31|nr:AlkA N-terminal domain-containing protein [Acidovorax sp. 69]
MTLPPAPSSTATHAAPPASDEGRYLALQTRDARFDGHFFTGVTSTGIYCRPVCAVRTPRRENCRFFALAAQAESAGFRPCLRCRPELAPQSLVWSVQDASGILVQQAVRLLDAPDLWADRAPAPASSPRTEETQGATVARLAQRLGVSDRHLRRIFEAALGVSPLQYLQTRRLLTAKQLLTDTTMPVTQVALASGFASVRRFNAAFSGHYGLNPTQLRRSGGGDVTTPGTGRPPRNSALRLAWRPPFDVDALLAFFEKRQFHGVEWVIHSDDGPCLRRTVRLPSASTGLAQETTGWLSACFDVARRQVLLQTSDSLYPVLPLVIRRVRAMLDLDADPIAINAVLHPHFPQGDGLRVPGAFDGFELAVRAVLGQQITVAAARTLGQRLVERLGEPINTPWPELHRLFPTPALLAATDGDVLGQLGIVRQRQAAIGALARAVDSGALALHAGADVEQTTAALCALPGIGDWTAQYIAMRVLRWPDAFPAGDVALHKALGVQPLKNPARAATAASQAWRPWRSYAVLRAWAAGGSSAMPAASTDTKSL